MPCDALKRATWAGNELVEARSGVLADEYWLPVLRSYPTEPIRLIRWRLAAEIPTLKEKFNARSRYFGYHVQGDKDRAYVYVQKRDLVIDLCLPPGLSVELRKAGFEVRPRKNFQGNAEWLTGWRVPQSTRDVSTVVSWIRRALLSV